jgi:hypothetical protein
LPAVTTFLKGFVMWRLCSYLPSPQTLGNYMNYIVDAYSEFRNT